MSPSYGHAYLTSYGWTGTGTGLRKGAISKPLAIPPKKNLSGLGKDRDEAFPFWDHLFTAASKAITIKVSSDDDDENPPSRADPASISIPLRRTTTGIISNRRPISGTPASTSGSTTPNPTLNAETDAPDTNVATGRLSLIATAKREAAKRGLYARFFRGPVLGPNDDPRASVNTTSDLAPSYSSSVDPSSDSTPVPDRADDQDDVNIGRETNKSGKRKVEDRTETREERRERKRLKRERKAARAAKKAEKVEKLKGKKDRSDGVVRKARKQRGDVPHEADEASSGSKKARKRTKKSAVGCEGDVPGTAQKSEGGQEDTARRSPCTMDAADSQNVVLSTKKKKGKRKDTPS